MSDPSPRFETFEQFWPHFLSSHRKPSTRWAHVAAMGVGAAGALLALRYRRVWPAIAGFSAASAMAGGAHTIFEGNTPENANRPLWAARAFTRLCARTITGAIKAEVEGLEAKA